MNNSGVLIISHAVRERVSAKTMMNAGSLQDVSEEAANDFLNSKDLIGEILILVAFRMVCKFIILEIYVNTIK